MRKFERFTDEELDVLGLVVFASSISASIPKYLTVKDMKINLDLYNEILNEKMFRIKQKQSNKE